MAARSVYSSSVPSLPPPSPKSPPEYSDLYGKRREIAKIQMLEREIGFLEVSSNLKMIVTVFIISSSSCLFSPLKFNGMVTSECYCTIASVSVFVISFAN